ncbi:MAG: C1 family peptidase [Bacillota bacterium]
MVKKGVFFVDYSNRPPGVRLSPPDGRDFPVSKLVPAPERFPDRHVISPLPEVYDQNGYGMCVAFSLATIKEVQEWRERGYRTRYSPGFIYANRTDADFQGEGMVPREALDSILKDGVCTFDCFPYMSRVDKLKDRLLSVWAACFNEARPQRIKAYARLYSPEDVKSALMQLGPVMICIPVYPSFYGGGDLHPPDTNREEMNGRHAMTVTGWEKDRWIIRNSWGSQWGDGGNCTVPFDYPIDEMWSITDKYEPMSGRKTKYWRVQAGAYKLRKNADNMYSRLKKAGFDASIIVEGRLFLVLAGAFQHRGNAEKICKLMESKGFEHRILYF